MEFVATREKIAEYYLLLNGPYYVLYHPSHDFFLDCQYKKFFWKPLTTFFVSEPFFPDFCKNKNTVIYDFIIKQIEEIIVCPAKVYSFISVNIKGEDVHFINMEVDFINGFRLINEI